MGQDDSTADPRRRSADALAATVPQLPDTVSVSQDGQTSGQDGPKLARGTVLGERYCILAHLGAGGMGTVYAAHDILLDMPVALKFVRPDLARDLREKDRLWREVRLAQTITHENVVRTYTLEQRDGETFIVMELLPGLSLAELLEHGPLPVGEAVRIVRGVLAGLSAAHAKSIVHRDIKPHNIKVDGPRVVVMDFGIARSGAAAIEVPVPATISDVSPGTMLAGTPGFIAPEVLLGGRATKLSDLFAVGVLLHMMLLGGHPSAAGMPAARQGLSPGLRGVLDRLLAIDPGDRYASTDEALAALDRLEEAPAARRSPGRWLAAALVVAAGVVGLLVWPDGPPAGPARPAVAQPPPPPDAAPVVVPDAAPVVVESPPAVDAAPPPRRATRRPASPPPPVGPDPAPEVRERLELLDIQEE